MGTDGVEYWPMGLVQGNHLSFMKSVARCPDRVYAGRSPTREVVALPSKLRKHLTFATLVIAVLAFVAQPAAASVGDSASGAGYNDAVQESFTFTATEALVTRQLE